MLIVLSRAMPLGSWFPTSWNKLLFAAFCLAWSFACTNGQATSGQGTPSVSRPPPDTDVASPSPDGQRHGLLSPACEEADAPPGCGLASMYVGETLFLQVEIDKPHGPLEIEYLRFNEPDASNPPGATTPLCGLASPETRLIPEAVASAISQGPLTFKTCGEGVVLFSLYSPDDQPLLYEPLQYEVKIISAPESEPLPMNEMDAEFEALMADIEASGIHGAVQALQLICPAYVLSKSIEIREENRKQYEREGLGDLYRRLTQTSLTLEEAWQEVRETDKAKAFLGIIEWEYEAMKKLVREAEGCE